MISWEIPDGTPLPPPPILSEDALRILEKLKKSEAKLQAANALIGEQISTVNAVKAREAKLVAELDQAHAELAASCEQLETALALSEPLRDKLATVTSDLEEAEAEIERLTAELEAARRALQEQDTPKPTVATETKVDNEADEAAAAEREKALQEQAQAAEEIAKSRQELDQLREELDHLRAELDATAAEHATKAEQLDAQAGELDAQQAALEAATKALEEREAAAAAAQAAAAAGAADAEAAAAAATAAAAAAAATTAASDAAKELQDKLDAAEAALQQAQTELSEAQAEVEGLRAEIEALKSELAESAAAREALDANVAQLTDDLDVARAEIADLQAGQPQAEDNKDEPAPAPAPEPEPEEEEVVGLGVAVTDGSALTTGDPEQDAAALALAVQMRDRAQKQLGALKEKNAKLEETNKALREDIEKAYARLKLLSTDSSAAGKQLRAEYEALNETLARTQSELVALQATANDLENSQEVAVRAAKTAEDQLRTCNQQLAAHLKDPNAPDPAGVAWFLNERTRDVADYLRKAGDPSEDGVWCCPTPVLFHTLPVVLLDLTDWAGLTSTLCDLLYLYHFINECGVSSALEAVGMTLERLKEYRDEDTERRIDPRHFILPGAKGRKALHVRLHLDLEGAPSVSADAVEAAVAKLLETPARNVKADVHGTIADIVVEVNKKGTLQEQEAKLVAMGGRLLTAQRASRLVLGALVVSVQELGSVGDSLQTSFDFLTANAAALSAHPSSIFSVAAASENAIVAGWAETVKSKAQLLADAATGVAPTTARSPSSPPLLAGPDPWTPSGNTQTATPSSVDPAELLLLETKVNMLLQCGAVAHDEFLVEQLAHARDSLNSSLLGNPLEPSDAMLQQVSETHGPAAAFLALHRTGAPQSSIISLALDATAVEEKDLVRGLAKLCGDEIAPSVIKIEEKFATIRLSQKMSGTGNPEAAAAAVAAAAVDPHSKLRKVAKITGLGPGLTTWASVKAFVSATGPDMVSERRFLAKYVFPAIAAKAASRRVDFSGIDLRETTEAADNGLAAPVAYHLATAEKCLARQPVGGGKASLGLVLLGDTEGWAPRDGSDCLAILQHRFPWCKESPAEAAKAADLVAAPPKQEALSVRTPKDKPVPAPAEPPRPWTLQALELHQMLFRRPTGSDTAVHAFTRACEWERDLDVKVASDIPAKALTNFQERTEDGKTRVKALQEAVKVKLSESNRHTYTATLGWFDRDGLDDNESLDQLASRVRLQGMVEFGLAVFDAVWDELQTRYPPRPAPINSSDSERLLQSTAASALTKHISPSDDGGSHARIITRLDKLIHTTLHPRITTMRASTVSDAKPTKRLATVYGPAGTGKSTILAKLAQAHSAKKDAKTKIVFFTAAPWHTMGSALAYLCAEMEPMYRNTGPGSMDKLREGIKNCCSLKTGRRLLLVIDAPYLLSPALLAQELTADKFEGNLPQGWGVVASGLGPAEGDGVRDFVENIQILELDQSDREKLLTSAAAGAGLSLSPAALEILMGKQEGGQPFYLHLAVQELLACGLSDAVLEGLEGTACNLLEHCTLPRLEATFGQAPVRSLLQLLSCRPGLPASLLAALGTPKLTDDLLVSVLSMLKPALWVGSEESGFSQMAAGATLCRAIERRYCRRGESGRGTERALWAHRLQSTATIERLLSNGQTEEARLAQCRADIAALELQVLGLEGKYSVVMVERDQARGTVAKLQAAEKLRKEREAGMKPPEETEEQKQLKIEIARATAAEQQVEALKADLKLSRGVIKTLRRQEARMDAVRQQERDEEAKRAADREVERERERKRDRDRIREREKERERLAEKEKEKEKAEEMLRVRTEELASMKDRLDFLSAHAGRTKAKQQPSRAASPRARSGPVPHSRMLGAHEDAVIEQLFPWASRRISKNDVSVFARAFVADRTAPVTLALGIRETACWSPTWHDTTRLDLPRVPNSLKAPPNASPPRPGTAVATPPRQLDQSLTTPRQLDTSFATPRHHYHHQQQQQQHLQGLPPQPQHQGLQQQEQHQGLQQQEQHQGLQQQEQQQQHGLQQPQPPPGPPPLQRQGSAGGSRPRLPSSSPPPPAQHEDGYRGPPPAPAQHEDFYRGPEREYDVQIHDPSGPWPGPTGLRVQGR